MLVPLLVALVVVEVLFPAVLALARNRLLFYPWATPAPETGLPALAHVDGRLVRVRRADGRALAAYDVRPAGFDTEAGPVVLFLHGNAGNIALRAETLAWFAEGTGARVLLLEWSGFGGNDGSPSEEELAEDARAAFDHLVAEGVAPSRIVLYGESIGSAAATRLATEREVAGVVAQSGFSSLSSMALRAYPWLPLGALFVTGSFPSARHAAALRVPLLVVHGTADTIVPFEEGRRLHEAVPGSELLKVPGADHNDLFEVGGRAYLAELGERFRAWAGTVRPSPR